jgi:hypothetical protein
VVVSLDKYQKVWATIALTAAATELVAAAKQETTLSRIVWDSATGVNNPNYPKKLAVVNRSLIGGFLAWLFVHFAFGWLSWNPFTKVYCKSKD